MSSKFEEESSATTAATNAQNEESTALADREHQLKKNAEELNVVKILLNNDNVESKTYWNVLIFKRLCEILEKQYMLQQCSRPSSTINAFSKSVYSQNTGFLLPYNHQALGVQVCSILRLSMPL